MSRLSRRRALGTAAGVAAGIAVVGAASAGAVQRTPGGSPAENTSHGQDPAAPAPFDEVHQGRRIQGEPVAHAHGGHHAGHGDYRVLIDGRELHVMRNADGTWISVVNHYETFATPRAVARAAVAELQGAALVPLDLG
ncbi:tyrosinase cofactor [Streptomyces sp. CAU 1734]|uniref:apotyrosinase chaperone MelC1 n=1 Tax=Streptomyces sp. CAU 1734 TaxID=3140360 RepID=UPI003260506B